MEAGNTILQSIEIIFFQIIEFLFSDFSSMACVRTNTGLRLPGFKLARLLDAGGCGSWLEPLLVARVADPEPVSSGCFDRFRLLKEKNLGSGP